MKLFLAFHFLILMGSSLAAIYGDDDRFLMEGPSSSVAVLAQLQENRYQESDEGIT